MRSKRIKRKKDKSIFGRIIKIINILSNIIFTLLILFFMVFCVFLINAKVKGKQPEILGYRFYGVLTGSMEPNICAGDLVVTKNTAIDNIKIGDVITFTSRESNNTVTHRVDSIAVSNNINLITKGDANNIQDSGFVDSDHLIGKVVKVIPGFGTILKFLNEHKVIIMSVIIGLILLWTIAIKLLKKDKAVKCSDGGNN